MKEQMNFDADVTQLIKLVTHSVYSNTDIFLRELISNANDACQKARLKSLQDHNYLGNETDLEIRITTDTDKKIIEITDTGIGMTRDEVIENIGTIAKSGTKEFLKMLEKTQKKSSSKKSQDNKENKNTNLIGQFGIGFYSAFMVAEKVELETKAKDAEAVLWRSTGDGNYELDTSKKTTRGTTVRLFLSKEHEEYADYHRLRGLVKKHSNYIPVPIKMPKLKDGKVTKEQEQINDMQSLRTKQKNTIKPEEYEEFYKSLSYSDQGPLDIIHIHSEGVLNFKALLFIPKQPSGLEQIQGGMISEQEYGPSLYVQNVLIMENTKELLPVRLRFVKGVVETPDLSLNVSRELLQSNILLTKIQKALVKEIIRSLAYLAETKPEEYKEFYKYYNRYLKEGVYYDMENAEKIAGLLRYYSYKNKGIINFDEYIKRAESGELRAESKKTKKDDNRSKNEGDKKESDNISDTSDPSDESENSESSENSYIYYLTGKSIVELEQSPYLEQFKEHGIDVLLMDDPLDEYVVGALPSYKGYKLMSASSPEVQLGDKKKQEKDKKQIEKKTKENKDFLNDALKIIGEDKLEKIEFTNKIGDNLAVLITPTGQASPQMERIMKAMKQTIPPVKRILQINDKHPLVKQALQAYKKNQKDKNIEKIIRYAYEQAFLLAGGELEDMAGFIKRVNEMIK